MQRTALGFRALGMHGLQSSLELPTGETSAIMRSSSLVALKQNMIAFRNMKTEILRLQGIHTFLGVDLMEMNGAYF